MDLLLAVATEIAIQMRGSLSFILGLGGLFSIVKSGLVGTIGLPDLPDDIKKKRASLEADVNEARDEQRVIFAIVCVLFVCAMVLYLYLLRDVDADALAQGTDVLTSREAISALGIAIIAAAILMLDVYRTIRLNRLDRIIALG